MNLGAPASRLALFLYTRLSVTEIHLLVAMYLVGYPSTCMVDQDDVGFRKGFR